MKKFVVRNVRNFFEVNYVTHKQGLFGGKRGPSDARDGSAFVLGLVSRTN